MKKKSVKVALATAAAGVLAAVAFPGSAQAATGYIAACNNSGSYGFVQFPYRGDMESTIINPHSCWIASLSGLSNDEVVGYRQVNGVYEAVAYEYFNDASPTVFNF